MNQFEDRPAEWMLREAKFGGTCEQCGDAISAGDQVWMKPEVDADTGRKIWHVVHSHHGQPAS